MKARYFRAEKHGIGRIDLRHYSNGEGFMNFLRLPKISFGDLISNRHLGRYQRMS